MGPTRKLIMEGIIYTPEVTTVLIGTCQPFNARYLSAEAFDLEGKPSSLDQIFITSLLIGDQEQFVAPSQIPAEVFSPAHGPPLSNVRVNRQVRIAMTSRLPHPIRVRLTLSEAPPVRMRDLLQGSVLDPEVFVPLDLFGREKDDHPWANARHYLLGVNEMLEPRYGAIIANRSIGAEVVASARPSSRLACLFRPVRIMVAPASSHSYGLLDLQVDGQSRLGKRPSAPVPCIHFDPNEVGGSGWDVKRDFGTVLPGQEVKLLAMTTAPAEYAFMAALGGYLLPGVEPRDLTPCEACGNQHWTLNVETDETSLIVPTATCDGCKKKHVPETELVKKARAATIA